MYKPAGVVLLRPAGALSWLAAWRSLRLFCVVDWRQVALLPHTANPHLPHAAVRWQVGAVEQQPMSVREGGMSPAMMAKL